ncbi:MAG: hypothetical protein A2010_11540 [Nitrospirae bacterium GWD2_57_9]|nr:MAG: hypothetical protein A2010_11540 [Nitrospirae bacterium GWD2_57_9]
MTTMKSIALISDHASPLADLGGVDSGGQNVYVKQVASHLASRGYEVDVFTRRDDPGLAEIVDCESGVRVIHLDAGPPAFIRKEELLQHMDEFTGNMVRFCSRKMYDIVHANFWMSGLVAVNVKRMLRIPFVITFHALGRIRRLYQNEADRFPDDRFRIEDLIVREADGIIAECPQDRVDLMDFYQAESGKICIIPCGFDPREIFPVDKAVARRALGFNPGLPLVLQLGRIVPRKGIDTVIRGFARFLKKTGRRAQLAIVGGATKTADPATDPEIGRLQSIADEEGVREHVFFTGRAARDEVKYYFSAADVFVTTPWYEPFGITPLEAMACGTPVLGANVGGIKFTVKNDLTGQLLPSSDPEAVAEGLERLCGNPDLLERMGKNAIERVHRLFTWNIVAHKLAGFYKRISRSARYALDDLAFAGPERSGAAAETMRREKENNIWNL